MPAFIPGLELSHQYYWQIVRPLLDQHFPGLPHAAGLIGPGSEVLGFDTEMSMDHHWFPKVQIFLRNEDIDFSSQIYETLRWNLPPAFMNFPLHLEETPDEHGIYLMVRKDSPPFNHMVHPQTLGEFKSEYLGWENIHSPTLAEWLSTPSQIFRTITSGAVHYDAVGELSEFRTQLAWYPHDIWLYLLAAGWHRIGESEHLMPRAGYIGDELGSALIGSQLVSDIMLLCFLMEKKYAPYAKWFGSAFLQLECADEILPFLQRTISTGSWEKREVELAAAYRLLAGMHNNLGITKPLPEQVSSFHGRPFKVIHGDHFGDAILGEIKDHQVQKIASITLSGGIDQISDNTKFSTEKKTRKIIKRLYEI